MVSYTIANNEIGLQKNESRFLNENLVIVEISDMEAKRIFLAMTHSSHDKKLLTTRDHHGNANGTL